MTTVDEHTNMRFKDKVVLITGSSSGIGQQTLLMMAKEGAFVTIHGVTQKHIDETVELFRKSGILDERIHTVQGTLDKEETVKHLVEETVEKYGQLDVVVCNAAITCAPGDGDFFSMQCLRQVLEVNLISAINLVQLAIPHLIKTKGNVVLISSSMGNRTTFVGHFYGVSKAALDHYARYAGLLYGPLGVRINSLRVGMTRTRLYERVGKPTITDRFIEQCTKNSALKRMAEPSEIAEFILFMACEQSSYMSASVLDIDGGLSANAIQEPDDLMEQIGSIGYQSHGIPFP